MDLLSCSRQARRNLIFLEWSILYAATRSLLHTVKRNSMRVRRTSAPLTDRQAEVLAFVQARQRGEGMSPTLDEICTHFGFSSPNAAREHLRLIQKKGYLERAVGKPRAIRVAQSTSSRGTDVVRVPLLGRIPAGEPGSAVDDVEEILPLPRGKFCGGRLFALRVRGESMVGAGILDGDIAVFNADGEPADGSIAAVVLDEEATLKRLYRWNGGLRLVAENPAFRDRNIPRTQIASVRVAGVFVGLIRTR
jgi:repressor LexA